MGLAVVLVTVWFVYFDTGLDWGSADCAGKPCVFNYHPVLLVTAFGLLGFNGMACVSVCACAPRSAGGGEVAGPMGEKRTFERAYARACAQTVSLSLPLRKWRPRPKVGQRVHVSPLCPFRAGVLAACPRDSRPQPSSTAGEY